MTCPKCGKQMIFYDKVTRILKIEYGVTNRITIDRATCKKCGIYKRDLPSYILPFKHYRKDVIEGFKNGTLTQYDICFEDYPCQSTINEWLRPQK